MKTPRLFSSPLRHSRASCVSLPLTEQANSFVLILRLLFRLKNSNNNNVITTYFYKCACAACLEVKVIALALLLKQLPRAYKRASAMGGGFTFSEVRALPMTILAGTSIYVLSFFFVGRSTKKRKLRAAFPFSPCSLTEHHINDVVLRCNRVPLWASAVSLPNTVALEWVESVF